MVRPHVRKLITWCCTVPASAVFVVCLFLPQVKDCNGEVKTPFDTHTAPWMIALADDNYELDVTRAREVLGWEPRRSLRETLASMVTALQADQLGWYRENHLEPPP